MPSSFVDSVPPIMKLLIEHQPPRVVDVGPGWGKYGLMCREYLPNLQRLDAVEVAEGRWSKQIMRCQSTIYDHVEISDVRQLDPGFWDGYDVALFVDVIEHMTVKEGKKVLHAALSKRCIPIVSTPKVFEEQHDPHNPYETHVSCWTWEDLSPLAPVTDVSTIDSIIFMLGP